MRLLIAYVLLALIIATGCTGTQQPAQPQAASTQETALPSRTTPAPTPISQASVSDNTITIRDFSFTPQAITVKTGAIVRWENRDAVPHRIIFTDTKGVDTTIESTVLSPSQSYSRKFDTAGTYPYYCKIHPDMKGTIIVE